MALDLTLKAILVVFKGHLVSRISMWITGLRSTVKSDVGVSTGSKRSVPYDGARFMLLGNT